MRSEICGNAFSLGLDPGTANSNEFSLRELPHERRNPNTAFGRFVLQREPYPIVKPDAYRFRHGTSVTQYRKTRRRYRPMMLHVRVSRHSVPPASPPLLKRSDNDDQAALLGQR